MKNGNLSAKALKRIFKDGIGPTKLAKRRKVAKAKHLEDKEAEWEEIPLPKTSRKPVEVSDKKKRLQEATKKFLESGASAKELIAAIAEAEAAQKRKK